MSDPNNTRYSPWAVCAVDLDGKATHFTTDSESEATAWAIHRRAEHPTDRIVCQHGVHAPVFQLKEDETWKQVDTDLSAYPPKWKVSVMYRGIGATWEFPEQEEAETFAIGQRAASVRSEVIITEPSGKEWRVTPTGRLEVKQPDVWQMTTFHGPSQSPVHTSYRDYSKCLTQAVHRKKLDPDIKVTVTDPAGIERELELIPHWVYVTPLPDALSASYRDKDPWYKHQDVGDEGVVQHGTPAHHDAAILGVTREPQLQALAAGTGAPLPAPEKDQE